MNSAGRKRRVLKWTGLVLLPVMVFTWATSFAWFFCGELQLTRAAGASPTPHYHSFRFSISDGDLFFQHQPLELHESYLPQGIHWRDREWSGRVEMRALFPKLEVYPNNIGWDIRLPGWIPILVVAIPTIALCWRNRNRTPQRRRFLVRTGLVVSVLIVVVWGMSLPYSWRCDRFGSARAPAQLGTNLPIRFPVFSAYLHAGCFRVIRFEPFFAPSPVITSQWYVERDLHWPAWRPRYSGTGNFTIPLWILFIVVALPTSVLWLVSRIPPYCCQSCGYDLTGNTSGICPECGQSLTTNSMNKNR